MIGFYYPGSSRPYDTSRDPYVSSPETFDAIGEVCRALVEPYGPTVLQCRRLRPRVAVLNSAASLWFPGSPLWYSYANEQILPYCSLLLMNHVPFDVVFDDDVREGRLDDYDVLVIPRGDTLTRRMHERIVAFASKKRVIANSTMRAQVPGAERTDFDFTFESRVDGSALARGRGMTAEEHRVRMESYAETLKPLVSSVRGPATSDSKRVLINTLESGDLRYVFLVNDERTYGPRFGDSKLHFENGLRAKAHVRLTAEAEPALYDVIEKRRIEPSWNQGAAEFDLTLPAARGKIVAVLPERVGRVEVTTPKNCTRGKVYPISVRVLGASGKAFRGAFPVQVEILDPLGRPNEYSRYASVDADPWTLAFRPAVNDPAGDWTIRVTELVGRNRAEVSFELP